MGGIQNKTKEKTIEYIERSIDGESYYIGTFSPDDDTESISLSVNNPNFDSMFDKLKVGKSYELTYDDTKELIDIGPPLTHYTCGVITKVIDMSKVNMMKNRYEIKIQGFEGKQILIVGEKTKKKIVVGNVHSINYVKWRGRCYYRVIWLENCGY